MDSDQELPPILPRQSHNDIEAYPERERSMVEEEVTGYSKENALYDRVKQTGPRRRCFCIVLFTICIVALVAICMILVLMVPSMTEVTGTTQIENATAHMRRAVSQKQDTNKSHQCVVNAVGGNLIMPLFADECVHPWKLESRRGICFLDNERYIVVQSEGRYRIYCKVTFLNKPTMLTVRVTRGGIQLSMGKFASSVGVRLKYEFTGDVNLKSGDKLSINVDNSATVSMDIGKAYFRVKQL